jgi:hypothetical protein
MAEHTPAHAAEPSALAVWQREFYRLTMEEGYSHCDATEYLDRVGLGRPARREVWQKTRSGAFPSAPSTPRK